MSASLTVLGEGQAWRKHTLWAPLQGAGALHAHGVTQGHAWTATSVEMGRAGGQLCGAAPERWRAWRGQEGGRQRGEGKEKQAGLLKALGADLGAGGPGGCLYLARSPRHAAQHTARLQDGVLIIDGQAGS